ncbi:Uncharacterised protein [uncultured Ruminococcus sp.]|uniref:Uncharacterized protein n=1 Tax=Hydrogeniiclostridium mannosilyticum TaxID=2764322 RepID=A0A328UCS7_9FIRM|nr:hypothetical protein [Hydrogeniiclostridium mannosilyticum]RAQ28682.1 hypothetical protein DPQ25_07755 [Hydrogeniiclostridium mannosilyticum]SCH34873.1 Uncharacterised protein [uncultured Ruminococcus sp.]
MNKKTSLWSSVSVLIVAVLAVMAFIRGDIQIWLLSSIFAMWAVWAAIKFLLPYLKAQKYRYDARKLRKKRKQQLPKKALSIPDLSDPVGLVLLRHVNFRISAYLQSAYPEATWQWLEEFPEKIIAKGGTGRIQLYGVPDFNYADISFDQKADISCSLLKIVPMAEVQQVSGEKKTIPQQQSPVDPQIWYEKQGRNVLEGLIADLHSRGHHSLTIRDNGEIAITQADSEITRPAFETVPERTYWPRLVKVFEREGLAADITEGGMELSW